MVRLEIKKYLEEVETGNKKFILSRCSLKEYYFSKTMGNMLSAVMVVFVAVIFYYATLFIFFDHITFQHESFSNIYFVLTGSLVEDVRQISCAAIVWSIFKGVLYFCLYAMVSASFCMRISCGFLHFAMLYWHCIIYMCTGNCQFLLDILICICCFVRAF